MLDSPDPRNKKQERTELQAHRRRGVRKTRNTAHNERDRLRSVAQVITSKNATPGLKHQGGAAMRVCHIEIV